MKTFKFRGKRIDNGEWIYGSLVVETYPDFYNYSIRTKDEEDWTSKYRDVPVDKNTLGQFTGLKDKNDKEIYEGDIIRMHYFFDNYDPETLGAFEDEAEIIGVVKCELLGGFYVETVDDHSSCYLQWVEEPTEELEVLGNIYDNPELLEEQTDE